MPFFYWLDMLASVRKWGGSKGTCLLSRLCVSCGLLNGVRDLRLAGDLESLCLRLPGDLDTRLEGDLLGNLSNLPGDDLWRLGGVRERRLEGVLDRDILLRGDLDLDLGIPTLWPEVCLTHEYVKGFLLQT